MVEYLKIPFPCSSPPPPAGGFGGGRAGACWKSMFYIYALYNKKHNKIYIGQTKNLEERLKLHQNKMFFGSFTARLDGDWILVYKEFVGNREQALIREKQLKSFRGREFIKKHIPL